MRGVHYGLHPNPRQFVHPRHLQLHKVLRLFFPRMTRLGHMRCGFTSITRPGEPSSVTRCSIPPILIRHRNLSGYGSAYMICAPLACDDGKAAKGTGQEQKVAQREQPPFPPY